MGTTTSTDTTASAPGRRAAPSLAKRGLRTARSARAAAFVAGGAAVTLVLAACGGGGSDSQAEDIAPAAAAASPAAALPPATSPPATATANAAANAARGAMSATVTIEDTGCKVSDTNLGTGNITFTVKNTTTHDTEFYFGGAAGFVEGEVEPGETGELVVAAAEAGSYEAKCKVTADDRKSVDVFRVPLVVTGPPIVLAADGGAEKAVIEYTAWVTKMAQDFYPDVEAFADAVIAGNRTAAKSLYAKSRIGWESIEPVAESFGELDPRMDARDGDLEEGQTWGGWHRIEKALWENESLTPMAPVARQLEKDYEELLEELETVKLTPLQIAQGAKELIDEVARNKITGEENRYAHTDLSDFAANIDGARQAFESLEEVALAKDPSLEDKLDAAFAGVEKELDRHRKGDTFVPYTDLTKADISALQSVVDALGEPLSGLAAAVQ